MALVKRVWLALRAGVVAATLVACSGGPLEESEDDAALSQNYAPPTGSVTPLPVVNAPPPPPPPQAPPPSNASPPSPSPLPSPAATARLLPLAVGRMWNYSLTDLYGGPSYDSTCYGEQSSYVVGPGASYGLTPSFRYSFVCGVTVDAVIEGDRVTTYYLNGEFGGAPVIGLDEPVIAGHRWSGTIGVEFVWEDAGTVSVAAGTFADCWTRVRLDVDQGMTSETSTFCRGVGLVRHVDYVSLTMAELTSKNF